jgi:hypothetical protein
MNPNKSKLSALILVSLILGVAVAIFAARGLRQRTVHQSNHSEGHTSTSGNKFETTTNLPVKKSSVALDKAQQLIQVLRASAMKATDVQVLCLENAALLKKLRMLGTDAIPACLAEIADKTSPALLRNLLIEMVAHLAAQHDPRVGQAFMAIIADSTDDKTVRMRALLWIPETANQADGAKLLEMLPKQTDADLEFGIVRSLRGFKVAGSVDVLAGELSDEKNHLIRIAASHALASQGDEAALTILQKSVAAMQAEGSQENQPQENAVAVHCVLALGELPNSSSLPLLESVAKNPANSASVRSTAFDSIAAIGGTDAQQVLRRALKNESDESVLVYIARALTVLGEASDAPACLEKAAIVTDSYTKSELQRAARTLQKKG